jgi:hypothetical protein
VEEETCTNEKLVEYLNLKFKGKSSLIKHVFLELKGRGSLEVERI